MARKKNPMDAPMGSGMIRKTANTIAAQKKRNKSALDMARAARMGRKKKR